MNILLTGGAGYIGSTTANLLLDQGHRVTVIDNLSTGNVKNIPKKAQFLKTDIANKIKIKRLFKKNAFDIIIHFAAFIDVEESIRKPKKYINNNYLKTKKFLEICKLYNQKKIIFSSTAAVYAGNDKTSIKENSKKNQLVHMQFQNMNVKNILKKIVKLNI